MNMKKLLEKGDVFNLTKGMYAYAQIPERYAYSNASLSYEIVTKDIRIGDALQVTAQKKETELQSVARKIHRDAPFISMDEAYDFLKKSYQAKGKTLDNETFDDTELIGEYVVIHTENAGGGVQPSMIGSAPDIYPDGHNVQAKKLAANGSFDPDGAEITFYQTGAFTAMNEHVSVVRTMHLKNSVNS